jgi:hypothetical protein
VKRTPLERKVGLARTGRLPRHTRMAAKNAKRGGHRFPKRRDPAYCAWIRTLTCLLAGRANCAGRVECAHVKSRGAGGDDHANTVPLCTRHHREQHRDGIETFQWVCQFDLAAIAADLAERYPAARVWADHRGDE